MENNVTSVINTIADKLHSEELISDLKNYHDFIENSTNWSTITRLCSSGMTTAHFWYRRKSLHVYAYKTLLTALKISYTIPITLASCKKLFCYCD